MAEDHEHNASAEAEPDSPLLYLLIGFLIVGTIAVAIINMPKYMAG